MRFAIFYLFAACVMVFIIQILTGLDFLVLKSAEVLSRPWTLVSYMFLHGGLEHIFYNMFGLLLFGFVLEKIIGSEKFLKLYFSAGIVSGIGSVFFYDAVVGASGAIFGILGTLAVLRPNLIIFAFMWGLIDVTSLLPTPGIATAGHIFGLLAGLIYGFSLKLDFGKDKKREKKPDESELDKWEEEYMVK